MCNGVHDKHMSSIRKISILNIIDPKSERSQINQRIVVEGLESLHGLVLGTGHAFLAHN